jgi:DnaK suppressor protein
LEIVMATAKSGSKPAAKPSSKTPAQSAAQPKAGARPAAKTAAKTAVKAAAARAVAKGAAGKAAKTTRAAAAPAKKPAAKPAPKSAGKAPANQVRVPVKIKAAPSPAQSHIPHIDPRTLGQIIAKLEEMREESLNIVNVQMQSDLKLREESLDVGDDLDQASNEREREFNLIMHQRHLRRLHQIEEAFERIEDGSYGLCEGTDEPINPRRLLIMPLARYSLEYQEQQEKMMGRGIEEGSYYESEVSSFSQEE